MFDLSPIQIIIVLVIAVLVLGPTKLPQFSRAVGKGIRDFRGAMLGDDRHDDQPAPQPTQAAQAAPVTTATAGEPEQPTAAPDVLEGIVVSGDSPPGERPGPQG